MSFTSGTPLARVIPIVPADETPCPLALRERVREQLYPPYKAFAQLTRKYRRAAYEAGEQRRAAGHPVAWFNAALLQAGNWVEYKLAARDQSNLAQGLDHAEVNTALGWATDFTPTCAPAVRPSLTRKAITVMTASALVITPASADHLPLTKDQQGDLLAYMALCNSSGQRPDMPAPPCHAPKIGVAPRRNASLRLHGSL